MSDKKYYFTSYRCKNNYSKSFGYLCYTSNNCLKESEIINEVTKDIEKKYSIKYKNDDCIILSYNILEKEAYDNFLKM